MADGATSMDSEFPNLRASVVAAFRNAPPEMVAEILDGEISLLPRPRPRHARGSSRLGARLRPFDDPDEGEPGVWLILDEPELHLGTLPDIVVPDLAGWQRERLPEELFANDDASSISIAPDWICEIISPGTEAIDRGKKMRIWRREGVRHVWLVNPALKTLEIYRASSGGHVLVDTLSGDDSVRAEPFDAVAIPLRSLWSR